MKAVSIIAVLLIAVASALTLAPQTRLYQLQLTGGTLVLALIALVAILMRRDARRDRAVAEPARPAPVPVAANQAEAEVASFLALLQEKGRLVDFLMDNINPYPDAQVGAAARVVHAGCRSVLQQHFGIGPVREESEGSRVQVPAGYAADEYRLVGRISGEAPFTGVLVHRGWKTDIVKLPRILGGAAGRLPTIAPAEVELK